MSHKNGIQMTYTIILIPLCDLKQIVSSFALQFSLSCRQIVSCSEALSTTGPALFMLSSFMQSLYMGLGKLI